MTRSPSLLVILFSLLWWNKFSHATTIGTLFTPLLWVLKDAIELAVTKKWNKIPERGQLKDATVGESFLSVQSVQSVLVISCKFLILARHSQNLQNCPSFRDKVIWYLTAACQNGALTCCSYAFGSHVCMFLLRHLILCMCGGNYCLVSF